MTWDPSSIFLCISIAHLLEYQSRSFDRQPAQNGSSGEISAAIMSQGGREIIADASVLLKIKREEDEQPNCFTGSMSIGIWRLCVKRWMKGNLKHCTLFLLMNDFMICIMHRQIVKWLLPVWDVFFSGLFEFTSHFTQQRESSLYSHKLSLQHQLYWILGSTAGIIKLGALLQGISVVADKLIECALLLLLPRISKPDWRSQHWPQGY